ncbi:MAG: adenylate/guanylate cyclase domain-containing protein [Pseudomonadota bacterium]
MTVTVPSASARPRRRLLGIGPRSISLSVVLALGIGTLVLVAVAATLAVAVLASTRNTISLLEERADLILDLAVVRLTDHVDEAAIEVTDLAAEMANGNIDPTNELGMEYAIRAAMAVTPQVVALGLWRPDLTGTVGIRGANGVSVDSVVETSDPELLRDAIDAAAAHPDGYWGELVYVPELQVTIVNRRQPVFDGDDLIGMMVAGVSVRDLSHLMARIAQDDQESGPATAFMLYGDAGVLAHPVLAHPPPSGPIAQALAGRSQERPLLTVDQVADPVLIGLLDGTVEQPPILGSENSEDLTIQFVEVGDDDVLVLSRQLPGYGDEALLIGTHFPANAMASEIERLIGSAAIGVGIMVVAVLLGILMGKRLARPVARLTNRAAEVSETLDFSAVEPLPGSVISELNRQAQAFNTMISGVRWMDTYLPKTLVRRLVRKDFHEDVVSISRVLTVMFTDIKGFTAQSEGLRANDVAAFLNHHFTLLGRCIESEEGTIDKFIGDALMAFWSAPQRQNDHADRACRAALAIRACVAADNQARAERGEAPIIVRIGIHSGEVIAGNIGAPSRMNYTIVGDAVNIGQRLETLGKEVPEHPSGVTILISAETADLLTADTFALTPVGHHPVRGRSEGVEALSLDGYQEGASPAEVSPSEAEA